MPLQGALADGGAFASAATDDRRPGNRSWTSSLCTSMRGTDLDDLDARLAATLMERMAQPDGA